MHGRTQFIKITIISKLPGNESMLDPINDDLKSEDKHTIRCKYPEPLLFPHVLLHSLQHYDEQEHRQMKAFPHIATRHLEEIVLVKFLENTTFQFYKLKKNKLLVLSN